VVDALKAVAFGAVTERLQGRAASRGKALVTAGAAGVAVAVLTYRVLRSGEEEEDGAERGGGSDDTKSSRREADGDGDREEEREPVGAGA
jgi:hypothetical protein